MNTPISFEIAKLLKEKGFKKVCNSYYSKGTNLKTYKLGFCQTFSPMWHNLNNRYQKEDAYYAPTIAETIMWLYKEYGLWISADVGNQYWFFKIRFIDNRKIEGQLPDGIEVTLTNLLFSNTKIFKYESPTEAYLTAIEYVLTKLI